MPNELARRAMTDALKRGVKLQIITPGEHTDADTVRNASRATWGELLAAGGERKQTSPPRYRILRPEDEAEVERLYQRLKTVGNLDQKNSTDEK